MAEAIETLITLLFELYKDFFQTLPFWAQNFMNLFFWSLIMVLYAVFVWNFYRWIAKKDLIELNLYQYSKSDHPILRSVISGSLYLLEYLIILPFIVFIWFSLFTLFLMLLTENLELQTLLIISVTVVTSIRMTSYYKEDLARDLAKMIPLTLLAVAITQGLFDFERVLNQLFAMPEFLTHIWVYLLFIMIIEFSLRLIDLIFLKFELYEEKSVKAIDSN